VDEILSNSGLKFKLRRYIVVLREAGLVGGAG
jgi:hypothetical protein